MILAPAMPAWAGPPNGNSPTQPDRLLTDEALHVDQGICSTGGLYRLIQQGDGNLVLYKPGITRALWATGTGTAVETIMQGDGNLVAYDASGRAVWASNTWGNGPSTLYVQGDGNLAVRRNYDGVTTWTSNTTQLTPPIQPSGVTDRLLPGQGLYRAGAYLQSSNGLYQLTLEHDWGNLVITRVGIASMWSTAALPDDDWLGNLPTSSGLRIMRSDGPVFWSAGMAGRSSRGKGPATLIMQNDGDLVYIRNSDGVMLWHSNTAHP
jgi:hypothetical protein